MTTFFNFEADFVDSLRCIPMVVRLKLDTCGVKLKLAQWNHFSQAECQRLVELPCEEATEVLVYREYVCELILQHTGAAASLLSVEANPAWLNDREIPATVRDRATEVQLEITLFQWAGLTPIQRFALIKLTRSQHENNNFFPALREFGLLD
jgi:hypothetical protein